MIDDTVSTPNKLDSEKDSAATASGGCQALLQDLQPHHYWHEAVFQGHDIPDYCRHGLSYGGVWRRSSSHKPPLLLATVKGSDHQGRPFKWTARRHRKRVAQPSACPAAPPALRWLSAFDPRLHLANLSWWIAALFSLGSLLFVVSSAAALVEAVGNPSKQPPGLASLTAALVDWPTLVAANLCFLPGGILQLVEVTTMEHSAQVAAWKRSGAAGPAPRRRVLRPASADLRTVSFWAVAVQISGMLAFSVATICSLLATAVTLSDPVSTWTINFGFTYGGAAFTASSVLFCLEASGSWWRGLVPTRWRDLRSLSWQSAFWGLQGSIGFLIGGAGLYGAGAFSWKQTQWIQGIGNLGGSVWFLLSSLLMMLEQANPDHT